jgi:septal ring factor EnvC (AmiA/AmiB activator)
MRRFTCLILVLSLLSGCATTNSDPEVARAQIADQVETSVWGAITTAALICGIGLAVKSSSLCSKGALIASAGAGAVGGQIVGRHAAENRGQIAEREKALKVAKDKVNSDREQIIGAIDKNDANITTAEQALATFKANAAQGLVDVNKVREARDSFERDLSDVEKRKDDLTKNLKELDQVIASETRRSADRSSDLDAQLAYARGTRSTILLAIDRFASMSDRLRSMRDQLTSYVAGSP